VDVTALGIGIGIALCAAYTLIRLWRRHLVSVSGMFRVTLAGFLRPVGGALIKAAFSGNLGEMPANWREYVAASGAVAIGLSLRYVIAVFRSVLTRDTTATPAERDEGGK
jgi:hypothetical protein